MKDLAHPGLIKLKGILFLLIGLFSAGLLIMETPTIKVAALLAISIWCFCRFYYFAFYVIEHYVDPSFRFSGLWSFARYLLQRRKPDKPSAGRE
jgi:hypothetical protein